MPPTIGTSSDVAPKSHPNALTLNPKPIMPSTHAPLPHVRQLVQALELQACCYQTARQLEKALKSARSLKSRTLLSRALRDAVSSWDTATNAVRILKGKGLPKSAPERSHVRALAGRRWTVLDIDEVPGKEPKQLAAPATTGNGAGENGGSKKESLSDRGPSPRGPGGEGSGGWDEE